MAMIPALLNSAPSPVAFQMAQPAMHGWLQATDGEAGLQQSRLLNASIFEASISLSGRRKAFQVVLYNPLAWERPTEPIRVPVGAGSEDAGWTVTGGADAAYMIGCRLHVQTPILPVRVPVRTDTAHIGPDCHRWGRQGLLLSGWSGPGCADGGRPGQSPAAQGVCHLMHHRVRPPSLCCGTCG